MTAAAFSPRLPQHPTPRYGALVRTAGRSRKSTVRRHLEALEEAGYLARRDRPTHDPSPSRARLQWRVCPDKLVEGLEKLGYEAVTVERVMGWTDQDDTRDFTQPFTPKILEGARHSSAPCAPARAGGHPHRALILQELLYTSVRLDPWAPPPVEAALSYLNQALGLPESTIGDALGALEDDGYVHSIEAPAELEEEFGRVHGTLWQVCPEVIAHELRELGYEEATAAQVLGLHHLQPPEPDPCEVALSKLEPSLAQQIRERADLITPLCLEPIWPEVSPADCMAGSARRWLSSSPWACPWGSRPST